MGEFACVGVSKKKVVEKIGEDFVLPPRFDARDHTLTYVHYIA